MDWSDNGDFNDRSHPLAPGSRSLHCGHRRHLHLHGEARQRSHEHHDHRGHRDPSQDLQAEQRQRDHADHDLHPERGDPARRLRGRQRHQHDAARLPRAAAGVRPDHSGQRPQDQALHRRRFQDQDGVQHHPCLGHCPDGLDRAVRQLADLLPEPAERRLDHQGDQERALPARHGRRQRQGQHRQHDPRDRLRPQHLHRAGRRDVPGRAGCQGGHPGLRDGQLQPLQLRPDLDPRDLRDPPVPGDQREPGRGFAQARALRLQPRDLLSDRWQVLRPHDDPSAARRHRPVDPPDRLDHRQPRRGRRRHGPLPQGHAPDRAQDHLRSELR